MSAEELKYINAFNIVCEGEPGFLQKVENKYSGDWEKAWTKEGDNKINPEKEWQKVYKEGIKIITVHDKNYPKLLKQIIDPPFLLYVRGSMEAWQKSCLSVVGTRTLTEYGKRIAIDITAKIAETGFTVVSGLARGIDAVAHQATLDAEGITVAVLPSGADSRSVYPSMNQALAKKIVDKGGALISEYPIGYRPHEYNFPLRNRIISGMSKGTLVVEADIKSGSLITAHSALDQNRDVFAVPGSIFSRTSRGTHALIQKGAKLVTSADDILEEYGLLKQEAFKEIVGENESERKVLSVLTAEPLSVNDIIRLTCLNTAEVNTTLVLMELNKKIKNIGNNKYARYL